MEIQVERLKMAEEVADVELVPSVALEVDILSVKELLGMVSRHKLPRHVKRIKKAELPDRVLVLIGHKHTLCEHDIKVLSGHKMVDVKVPKSMPITQEQNTECQKHWPCHYFRREVLPEAGVSCVENVFVDLTSRFRMLHAVPCSGICMISLDGIVIHSEADTDNVSGHAIMKSISAVSRKRQGYLCTGLDAFVYREPCTSCAMAFVHGRISRVFFVESIPSGPYSHLRLCYNKSVNHRYPVYRIVASMHREQS